MPYADKDKKRAYDREYRKKRYVYRYSQHRKWIKDHPLSPLLSRTKARAKKFGLAFEIDYDDIVIPEFCPILGVKLEVSCIGKATDNSPSLDRIDNTKGYVKGNVAVISMRANKIKNCGTADEHLAIANWMIEQNMIQLEINEA